MIMPPGLRKFALAAHLTFSVGISCHGRLAFAHARRERAGRPGARGGRRQLDALGGDLLHPGLGLVVLLAIQVLNVYKPLGMTRYGWRKQLEQRNVPPVRAG
jgi:hypothetical protein